MTSGACDRIEKARAITVDERTINLVIKNSKTVRIKINRAIVVSSKSANIYEVFNNIECNKDIL